MVKRKKLLHAEVPAQHKPTHQEIDIKQFDGITLPPDLEKIKQDLMDEFITPWGLEFPPMAMKRLVDAMSAEGEKRAELIKKARFSAEMRYYGSWARGEIRKSESVPMDDETKQYLRELNKERREQKQADRAEAQERRKELEKADLIKPKKSKKPVFDDPDAQQLVLKKYPWAIPGSFKQDPEKAGGTNLDIKCQKCGNARTIHLADAFQVKLCINCKNGHNAKQGKVG